MTYGIKVARPGKNIGSTDVRDFTVHSGYNMLKVHPDFSAHGTVTLDASNGHYETVTVSHNLGYTPIFLLFFKRETDSVWKMPCWDDSNLYVAKRHDDDNTITVHIYHTRSDSSQLYPADEDVEYRYLTLVDPQDDVWY